MPEDYELEPATKVSFAVLRDTLRRAFGDYQVTALPSAVIIGKDSKVVSAVAGLISNFAHVVSDSLLLAARKLSREQFRKAREPQVAATQDETALRGQRLAALTRSNATGSTIHRI